MMQFIHDRQRDKAGILYTSREANLRRSLAAILEYLDGTCGHTDYCDGCNICDAVHSAKIGLEDCLYDTR
jgi:hypothetical protein